MQEGPRRGNLARYGRVAVVLRLQGGHEALQQFRRERAPRRYFLPLHEIQQLRQITPVGSHGVRGVPPLVLHIVKKLFETCLHVVYRKGRS